VSGRSVFLILAMLVLGAAAIFFGRAWLLSQAPAPTAVSEAPPKPVITMVLIAKQDIPIGTFLKEEMVGWQAWPNETLDPSYFVQGQTDAKTQAPFDIKSVVGTVSRLPIVAGQPITSARIVHPGEQGFLAAALKPGMRAITVAVNDTTGIAGLVFPGDRVDMLLTHELESAGAAAAQKRHVTETVLENIRVLAIDQSLAHQADAKQGGQQQPAAAPAIGKDATIEVNPKQAEMVAVASTLGALSLSLRSLASPDGGTVITDIRDIPDPSRGTTYTLDTDVSRVLAITPPRPVVTPSHGNVQRSIEVNRGGKVEQSVVN
jgi:pilus assembly protein CpaB